jgi:hypothetical protein
MCYFFDDGKVGKASSDREPLAKGTLLKCPSFAMGRGIRSQLTLLVKVSEDTNYEVGSIVRPLGRILVVLSCVNNEWWFIRISQGLMMKEREIEKEKEGRENRGFNVLQRHEEKGKMENRQKRLG